MEAEDRKFKRQVAFKVRIKDLLNGRYVKEEGWEPNYIITKNQRRISRINLMGTVVAKANEERMGESIILDDGSGRISVRAFKDDVLDKAAIGDIFVLIGRPREYGGEKYIVPEILKKINDAGWIELRKLELEKEGGKVVEEEGDSVEIEGLAEEVPLSQKVIDLIRGRDEGEGVDTDEIIEVYGSDVERIINGLLINGEIFEIRPGKLKVLE